MSSFGPCHIAALLAVFGVAGCTSTGCDPSRAGFVESLGCSGGGFQARQTNLQNSLAQQQAEDLEQQARAAQASQEATAAKADLAKRRRDLAKLDNRLTALRHELDQARHRGTADRTTLDHVSREVSDLQTERTQLIATDPDPQTMQRLMAREDKLMEMLKSME